MNHVSSNQQAQLHRFSGVPGVIYILRNSALREGYLHIGLTRRTGYSKALELNRDQKLGIPGEYECVFEMRAQDSGAALEKIFKGLQSFRRGKREQDFFEIAVEHAQRIVEFSIEQTDFALRQRAREEDALPKKVREITSTEDLSLLSNHEPIRKGIFDTAYRWVAAKMN
jgi:hypothetical protein